MADMNQELLDPLDEGEQDPNDRQDDSGQLPVPALPVSADSLQMYLAEVRRIPMLTPEQEKELALQYRETGDKASAYRLVTANLRLVVKIALDYQRQWMLNLMDLIQEGNLGLMQAVKNFDPYRGAKLSYYASYWIKAYILKFVMDNWRLVKIGTTQAQRKLFFNLQKEKNRLEKMGFYPGPARLAEAFDLEEDKIIEMEQRLGDWEPSLDHPAGDDWRETRGDLMSGTGELFDARLADAQMHQLFMSKLSEFKKTIDEKELDVLERRILAEEPATLLSIGDKYGVTKERVRQIESRLISKIKNYMQEQLPDLARIELPSASGTDGKERGPA